MKNFLAKIIAPCSIITSLVGAQGKMSELCTIASHVKEFYFVRHGQTDFNVQHGKTDYARINACVDMSLNQHGQYQARTIQPCISLLPIKTVCCSPLKRAKETKNIIMQQLRVTEHEIEHLTECSVDAWKAMNILKTHGHAHASTPVQDFVKQVSTGLEISLSHDAPVLIIAHGGVHYALCYLLGVDADDWTIDNCVPVRFYVDYNGRWKREKLS